MGGTANGRAAKAAALEHLTVDIVSECAAWDACPGLEAMIVDAARRAYASVETTAAAGVTVALLSDADVQRLNRQFRGKDRPTNVLSFPATTGGLAPDADAPPAEERALGDLALAYETVAAEALEARIPLLHHVAHLVIHGVLHLLGHDHETDADAERMESLETTLLARMGIADPYAA